MMQILHVSNRVLHNGRPVTLVPTQNTGASKLPISEPQQSPTEDLHQRGVVPRDVFRDGIILDQYECQTWLEVDKVINRKVQTFTGLFPTWRMQRDMSGSVHVDG